MFRDRMGLKGQVTAVVRGPDGRIKQREPSFLQRLLKLPGALEISVNHNIVTNEGDAMVADILQITPERTKVDNTNGYIEVGTGFTSESKAATSCTTPTGSPEVMDATYPQTKGNWGAADDNVIVYVATFEAGDLNATGIDEAALLNGGTATTADCLAYAQINPSVNVTTADTLEVTWEITFLGS